MKFAELFLHVLRVLCIQSYAVEIQTSDTAELALDYVREALQKAGGAAYGTGVRDTD